MRAVLDRVPPDRSSLGTVPSENAADARVTRLEATVAALVHRVEQLERAHAPHAGHDDESFLATIRAHVGARVFTARALRRHARLHPALAATLAHSTTAQVGLRLRRMAGRTVGAYRLQRVKRDNRGTWWVVKIASDLHPTP